MAGLGVPSTCRHVRALQGTRSSALSSPRDAAAPQPVLEPFQAWRWIYLIQADRCVLASHCPGALCVQVAAKRWWCALPYCNRALTHTKHVAQNVNPHAKWQFEHVRMSRRTPITPCKHQTRPIQWLSSAGSPRTTREWIQVYDTLRCVQLRILNTQISIRVRQHSNHPRPVIFNTSGFFMSPTQQH